MVVGEHLQPCGETIFLNNLTLSKVSIAITVGLCLASAVVYVPGMLLGRSKENKVLYAF